MGIVGAIATGVQIVLLIGIVAMLGFTIYYLIHRTDSDVLPADWLPDWYKNFVHQYPTNYSQSVTSNVIASGTVTNATFTANSASDCVNKSKTGCSNDPNCVGFVYHVDNTSNINTCSTLSSAENLFVDSSVTSNTLYTVQGSEPNKYYALYTSNVINTTAPASLIPSYQAQTYFDCASNCASNVTCLGFEWNPTATTNNCIQHTAITTSNVVSSTTGFNSYILSPALTLMNSSPVTFSNT
jgi:hypothetical protein